MKVYVFSAILLLVSASVIEANNTKVCKKADITRLERILKSDFTELENTLGSDIAVQFTKLETKLLAKLDELKDQKCCDKDGHDNGKEIVHRDCATVLSNTGKVADIELVSGKTFQAFCKQGWLSIARRFDGSLDFYRTWQQYEKGFGNPPGEYFIGLENLAEILSQRTYRLRVELTTWSPTEIRFAEYSTFDVAGKSKKYQLTIGGHSGTASDSLKRQNGMAFTTKDRDNDISSSVNCAELSTGAWWYDDCHESNLFGTYYPRGQSSYGKGLNWRYWKGYEYSFKKIDMKIHRI